jgi:hypothetical protein
MKIRPVEILKYQNSLKIRPVEIELFQADGRTEGRMGRSFSLFYGRALRWFNTLGDSVRKKILRCNNKSLISGLGRLNDVKYKRFNTTADL